MVARAANRISPDSPPAARDAFSILSVIGNGPMDTSATAAPNDERTTVVPGQTTFVEDVEIVGHIIDSLILPKVLDEIMGLGGRFEIREIRVGQRRNDPSYAQLRVIGGTPEHLERLLAAIGPTRGRPAQPAGLPPVAGRYGRRFSRRLLFDHQPGHADPPQGKLGPRTKAGNGLRRRVDPVQLHAECVPMIEVRHGDHDCRRAAPARACFQPSGTRRGTTPSAS